MTLDRQKRGNSHSPLYDKISGNEYVSIKFNSEDKIGILIVLLPANPSVSLTTRHDDPNFRGLIATIYFFVFDNQANLHIPYEVCL